MLLVIGTGIFKLEPFREIVVNLDGAKLPAATKRILNHEVELGSIERGFAKFLTCLQALFLAGFDNGGFRKMPVFIASDIFLGIFRIAK